MSDTTANEPVSACAITDRNAASRNDGEEESPLPTEVPAGYEAVYRELERRCESARAKGWRFASGFMGVSWDYWNNRYLQIRFTPCGCLVGAGLFETHGRHGNHWQDLADQLGVRRACTSGMTQGFDGLPRLDAAAVFRHLEDAEAFQAGWQLGRLFRRRYLETQPCGAASSEGAADVPASSS